MAKGQKTGGRVRGVPNRASIARQAEVAASGLTPLDFMLTALRNESLDFLARFEAAKAAAPYVHPKLTTTKLTGDEDEPIQQVLRWANSTSEATPDPSKS